MKLSTESVTTTPSTTTHPTARPGSPKTDWRLYAAAGSAALAATSAADASIIYNQINVRTINPAGRSFRVAGVQEDFFNHDTTNPFTAHTERSVQGLQGGLKILLDGNASPYAVNFYAGAPITGNFKSNVGVLHQVRGQLDSNSNLKTGSTTIRGHFSNGYAQGIVGFQLANGDKGWLRLEFESGFPDSQNFSMQVIDYAYNDVAGAPINAGQTVSVPEPDSKAMALLAFGSAGVLAWRRRRTPLVDISKQQ